MLSLESGQMEGDAAARRFAVTRGAVLMFSNVARACTATHYWLGRCGRGGVGVVRPTVTFEL